MVLNYRAESRGGPAPKFTLYHVWKAYTVIVNRGPIGRKALANELGIGEGSTRTILDAMLADDCIENTRRGTIITEKGREKLESIGLEVNDIPSTPLTVSTCNFAVMIRRMADKIVLGCEQRDMAVRAGAAGATTLVCVNGKLKFPENRGDGSEDLLGSLRRYFHYKDGDVIIIGSATTFFVAERGAVTAGLHLISKDKRAGSGQGAIRCDSDAYQLLPIAMALHEMLGRIPIGIRSRNRPGVRLIDGAVVDVDYTCKIAEEALRDQKRVAYTSASGPFMDMPMVAQPVLDNDTAVAVIVMADISASGVFERLRRKGS